MRVFIKDKGEGIVGPTWPAFLNFILVENVLIKLCVCLDKRNKLWLIILLICDQ